MLRKICCLNSEACDCTCWSLTRNKNVKIGYIVLILLAYGVLLMVNALMYPMGEDVCVAYGCETEVDREECVRDKNGEIIFAAVGFMHFIVLCCMFLKSEKVKVINEGIWLIKIMVIALAALVYRLVVGTVFFQYLGYFSIWGANILYVFEGIVFVDLVYALDGRFDECAKDNNKFYIFKAIISISVLVAASFVCFISFKHNPTWVCITNAVLLGVFVVLALLRVFQGNSIFVAASIGLFLNVLGFYISQTSNGHTLQYSTFLQVFKLLFLMFLLLGMLCQGSNKLRTRKSTLNELMALNTNASEQDNRYVSSNKWTVYHYVMMMIAVAIPAVLCWEGEERSEQERVWLGVNKLVWWGGVLFFYLWSLVTSKIYPEQDFSDLENYFREYQLS